ncbi:lytic murein transglycosylase [Kribbella sandramycini]|uniref:Lytic murein transglycosylase n=1 Tax=Kribbella sandramycini TaxID=60450 RepID=A0A7Y4P348_9ACTN|nr:lytic murein transglycosylase [Kribbella sandramycini]MBB6570584.1 membrane-bound lytic murein transglycosylase B [Kribbella sandramycini]NOL43730.1 lytic murein transglycosylase [Kribbella sandramycini]
MRQQFKNLDTWRGKLTATWVCLAPPTAMVAVFVVGGVTSNTFIVDAHALAQPRPDSVFDELANNLPPGPGVDGSLPTQEKSTIQVPITGTTDGSVNPIQGVTGNTSGIPNTVLAAYQKVAADLAAAKPGCHLTWPLLAGIGKIESDHAKGGKVDAKGDTRGQILGPVLNGGPGMAAISDSDQGQFDGNTQWDRAVGPMQFIPGTWKAFGADGNGDGVKNPHNIYDAARAAGDYLCSGGSNLADAQALVKAVLRYNHSMDYVSNVLRWMQSYSKQTVTVPNDDGSIDNPGDDGNANDPGRTDTTPTPTPTPTITPSPTKPTSPKPSSPKPPNTPGGTPTTPKPSTPPPSTPKPPVTPPTKYTPRPTPTPTTPTTPTSPTPKPPACSPSTPPTTTPEETPSTTPEATPTEQAKAEAQAEEPTPTCTTPPPDPEAAAATPQDAPKTVS